MTEWKCVMLWAGPWRGWDLSLVLQIFLTRQPLFIHCFVLQINVRVSLTRNLLIESIRVRLWQVGLCFLIVTAEDSDWQIHINAAHLLFSLLKIKNVVFPVILRAAVSFLSDGETAAPFYLGCWGQTWMLLSLLSKIWGRTCRTSWAC